MENSQYAIDTYAVIGNPVAHSKSPLIHTEFAKQTQQKLQYLKIISPLDQFFETVTQFKQRGGKGLNVTLPFKEQAYHYVSECSARARLAKAVNTIVFNKDGNSYGDNTDGVGLIRDLSLNHHFSLRDKRILVLGAGGAVRGILAPLLAEHPQYLVIANRTVEKAQQLHQEFSHLGQIQSCGFSQFPEQVFDLIINGTSASLSAELPPLPGVLVSPETFCYDLVFSDKPTIFLQWAKQHGAQHSADGLGMLVEQAAESFYIWRGIRPNTQPILALLKKGRS